MRVFAVGLAILFVATCGSPVAFASGTPSLLIFHEIPGNVSYAGFPGQFGYIVLDGDERPVVHKQGKIRIDDADGRVVYETEGLDSAHDYDALNPLWFTFDRPGNYTVHAEVPYAASTLLTADYPVRVLEPPPPVHATLEVLPEAGPGTHKFTIRVTAAEGKLIPHSDVLLEIRRGFHLDFRVHLHANEDPMAFEYAFEQRGRYTVRALAYQAHPTPDAVNFRPVVKTVEVDVQAPDVQPVHPEPLTPPGASGQHQPYRLYASYDPAPGSACPGAVCVTPFGNLRLSGFVYDSFKKQAAEHVDFKARLIGPSGPVFDSKTLHEYDGHFELVLNRALVGDYSLQLVATKEGWQQVLQMPFRVAPPVFNADQSAGPLLVHVDHPPGLVAGLTTHLAFRLSTLAGGPALHSEIEFQLAPVADGARDSWGAPVLINKLHTHDSGTFGADVVFPSPGKYRIVLDPETVHGEPTPTYFLNDLGKPLDLVVDVQGLSPVDPPVPIVVTPAHGVPFPTLAFALIGMTAAALILRRRHA